MIRYDVEVCSPVRDIDGEMKYGLLAVEVKRLVSAMEDGDALVINAKDEAPSL